MWTYDETQDSIIRHRGGTLVVTGGPGTGKSATLKRRVADLISEGVPAARILIISAEGSSRRVLAADIGGIPGLKVESPASFVLRQMRACGRECRILSRFDEFLYLQSILGGRIEGAPIWPYGRSGGTIQSLQESLDSLRRGDKRAEPGGFLDALDGFMSRHYQQKKWLPHTGVVRFALNEGGNAIVEAARTYSFLLVDTIEAMRPAERLLILKLADEVMDAVLFTSVPFPEGPELPVRHLSLKYRPDPAASFWHFNDAVEEAAGVAAIVAGEIQAGMEPHRIMVLYRDYPSLGGELEAAFRLSGIPLEVRGGRPLVRGAAARFLVRYLESLLNPDDDDAIFRWLASPLVGTDLLTLRRLQRGVRRSGMRFHDFMKVKGMIWPGSDHIVELMAWFQHDLEHAETESLLTLAGDFLRRAGVTGRLLAMEPGTGTRGDEELRQLGQFLQLMEAFDRGFSRLPGNAGPIQAFLETCSAFWDESATEGDAPAVQLMGVHQARGLEVDVVVLCGAVDGNFPRMGPDDPLDASLGVHVADGAHDRHAKEEDLFEIGMTRSIHRLIVTCAGRYGRNESKPSPFAIGRLGEPSPFDWGTPRESEPKTGSRGEGRPPVAVAPRSYSHSSIRTFLGCPRRYFFRHILKVEEESGPGATLGRLIHDTLAAFHHRHPDLEKVPPSAAAASMRELLAEASAIYGPELGPPLMARGIQQAAQDLLTTYLESMAYPDWSAREVQRIESVFSFELGGRRLGGRIDRVDRKADGTLEVIDYKTSASDTHSDAAIKRLFLNTTGDDNYAPQDFQLPIYYMAMAGDAPVSSVSYFQLATGKVRRFSIDPEKAGRSQPKDPEITGGDLAQTRELLQMALDRMEAGAYPAEPANSRDCSSCPYAWVCPRETGSGESEEAEGE